MGLLTAGKPLTWEESLKFLAYVKDHGIEQFINIWKDYKDNTNDLPLWGDEIEYILLHLPNDNENSVQLSLRSKEIQDDVLNYMSNFANIIDSKTQTNNTNNNNNNTNNKITDIEKCIVHPEYGSHMIETTPNVPYGISGNDFINVEINMLYRREWIESQLNKNEKLLMLPAFPIMGVGQYLFPYHPPNGNIARSQFISDTLINPHPRFGTLTQNIRKRRGKLVDIRVPLFKDTNTNPNDTEIYMDAMAFGMGCCCLQTTYQAKDLNEARYIYDHLSCITPLLMALTACTPFLKGKVSDYDCRWTVIEQSVDDRNDFEMGFTNDQKNDNNESENKQEKQRIYKSRYSTIDSFLNTNDDFKGEYEDIEVVKNKKYYDYLLSNGIDKQLAKHISHLFIRDPLAIYSDIIDVNDKESTYHFETIQSTNWNNVRFKPPPPKNENKYNIGWRIEFRTMEVQITEFENAAFSIFIILLTRAIIYYNLNFYINISQIDENLHLAHKNNAVNTQKFWWHMQNNNNDNNNNDNDDSTIRKMTIKDIFCGTKENEGLIDIVTKYINEYEEGTFYSKKEKEDILEYLNFIKLRAKGDIMTGAQWLRKFVMNNKNYNNDSIITDKLCREITDVLDDIVHGKVNVPELLGNNINIKQRRDERIKVKIPKKSELNINTPLETSSSLLQTKKGDIIINTNDSIKKNNSFSDPSDKSQTSVIELNVSGGEASTCSTAESCSLSSSSLTKPIIGKKPTRSCCFRLFGW